MTTNPAEPRPEPPTPAEDSTSEATVSDHREGPREPALLRVEYRGRHCVIDPREAVRIRDGLRRDESRDAERLATIIDAKATELLAAPLFARNVSVRLDQQEAERLTAMLAEWRSDGAVSTDVDHLWAVLAPSPDSRDETVRAATNGVATARARA